MNHGETAMTKETSQPQEDVFEVPELQWTMLADPATVEQVARHREREELLAMAEQMEYENALKDRPFAGLTKAWGRVLDQQARA